MNMTSIFIQRPVATTLLAIGLALAGMVAFFLMPVAPMPNIDIPTISVTASMAGASPDNMSTSVATPLERHLGAIAGVTEMTSTSSAGSTRITLQFDIHRDIDGAARDVQAAIVAARVDLPSSLRSNPTYKKVNPAASPILLLGMTSKTLTPGGIYDAAENIVQQKLSQVTGVGDVEPQGAALPAVRVELNPRALFKYGIGLEVVRSAISAANAGANTPKGMLEAGPLRYQVYVNDLASTAADFSGLIVAYRNNAPVRLSDVATVYDGVEDIRQMGIVNGQPGVIVTVQQQPGANVIETVDRIKKILPALQAEIPKSIDLTILQDSTIPIHNSMRDVEFTLVISTICVIFVVFFFLRNLRSVLVPSVAVPLSLLGTFGVMYLVGFSLDNFSLMALVISTGFVVDDAIVVLENVTRHLENGESRINAALSGAREVSFTVVSMSVSLVAVFLPVLLLGGIVGRLFHEFALTLTIAILMSLLVSLTVTPMMCAYLTVNSADSQHFIARAARAAFDVSLRFYEHTLKWALSNPLTIMFILLVAIGLNGWLLYVIPKGFFPVQDEGRLQGGVRADQTISFQLLKQKYMQFVKIVRDDPAVAQMGGYASSGSGTIFATLKPLSQRDSTDAVIARLRLKTATVAGAQLFMQGAQQIRSGGRQSLSTYQFTLQGDTLSDLNEWVPKITDALSNIPELDDVNSDQQTKALEEDLSIDRATAARLGINLTQIDSTLQDAFSQRTVSTIYEDRNQYYVVMEVAPQFWQSPETLKDIYVSTSGGALSGTQATSAAAGTTVLSSTASQTTADTANSSTTATTTSNAQENAQENALTTTGKAGGSTAASEDTSVETMVPLSDFVKFAPGTTPLSINHQGPFVATTISFNLPEGEPLGVAMDAINRTMATIHVPISVHGQFAGTAGTFQSSLGNEVPLILSALVTIYIVLGVLYESYVHPLTILSTLPSAGVGAVLALLIFKLEFSLIALIGVLLLIGIVKKNAIMMIDFAIAGQKQDNLDAHEAIFRACLLRFRPIMMTTLAAILGAVPLAIGFGAGSELRQPLGISIVGGLLLSQALTLYTTPVIYLYLDRWRVACKRAWDRWYGGMFGGAVDGQLAE